MSKIEKEIRLEVTCEEIKKIIKNTNSISRKERMIDITCGKYGFDSLSKVGYICRIRSKGNKNSLEIKNYINIVKCLEKSIPIASINDGIEFLKLLDMEPYLVLDRKREIRKYEELIICIDEFDKDIGNYIEIEFQNADKKTALKFIKDMGIKNIPKEKYGDIIKLKIEKDKKFKNKIINSLSKYK